MVVQNKRRYVLKQKNLPALRDTSCTWKGRLAKGGISGGFHFSDGGPKALRVRNVDSWNLGCGSTFRDSSLYFLPSPPMSSVPHTVTLKTLWSVTTIQCRVDRKSKLREELRVRKAQTYAHLVQQVAVRARS